MRRFGAIGSFVHGRAVDVPSRRDAGLAQALADVRMVAADGLWRQAESVAA